MAPPEGVNLGPLTRIVLGGAIWRDRSQYPAFQEWADDLECILSFLDAQRVLADFLPRLQAREWEGALAESRAAYFFYRSGFCILGWQPSAVENCPGDLEVQWQGGETVFVEVKGPSWKGELTEEERLAGRTQFAKYPNGTGEARAINLEPLRYVIAEKALPKLAPSRINLIVVIDDFFFPTVLLPKEHLDGAIIGWITGHPEIGGVLLIRSVLHLSDSVEYQHHLVVNPNAYRPLPADTRSGIMAPEWAR